MHHQHKVQKKNLKKFSPSVLFLLLAFSTLPPSECSSTDYSWNQTGSGAWNVNGNWSPTGFPQVEDDTANLGNIISTGTATISLNQAITIGSLIFDSQNSSKSYTIASGSGGPLTFSNSSTTSQISLNNSVSESHLISADIQTASPTTLIGISPNGVGSATTNLEISGQFLSPTQSAYVSGTATLTLSGPNSNDLAFIVDNEAQAFFNKTSPATSVSAGLTVNLGGTATCYGPNQIQGSVTIASGGSLNFGPYIDTVGAIDNSGSISAGARVTTTGYTHEPGANLYLDISDSAALNYGYIYSTGPIVISTSSSTLEVTNNGGYVPSAGSHLVLLQGTTRTGTFNSASYLGPESHFFSYPTNQVWLNFTSGGCTNGFWIGTASSTVWGDTAPNNWSTTCAAPGSDNTPSDNATANFDDVAGAPSAVTVIMENSALNAFQSVTLQSLNFTAVSTNYTLNQYPTPAGTITLDGSPTPTINVTAGNPTINVPIIRNQNSAFSVAAGSTLTLGTSAVISDTVSGLFSLTNNGSGTVILEAKNTYQGSTIVNAGTLQAGTTSGLGVNGAFGNSSSIIMNGGRIALETFNTIIGNLSGGSGTVDLGSATLTIQNSGINTYSGTIVGTSSGTLTLNAGTLTLSGLNTYSGPTNVMNGATLTAGTPTSGSAGPFGNGSVITIATGGDVEFGDNAVIVGSIQNNGTVSTGAPITTTLTSGSYFQNASGVLNIDVSTSDASIYGSITTPSGGTIMLEGTPPLHITNSGGYTPLFSAPPLVLFNGSPVTGTLFYTPSVFPGSYLSYPTNQVLLNFPPFPCSIGTWIGTTTPASWGDTAPNNWSATCPAPGSDNTPSDNASATFDDVGGAPSAVTVIMENTAQDSAQSVTLQSLNFTASSTTFTLNQYLGFAGTITLDGAPTPTISVTAGNPVVNVPIIRNQNSIFSVASGSTLTLGTPAVISDTISGPFSLTNNGLGVVVLGGASTYTGATIINAGTLQAGVATVTGVSGAFGNSSAVTMSAGTLALETFDNTIESLSGLGATSASVNLGTATLTVTNGGGNEFDGIISDTSTGGALILNGGTLILGGANTYSGGTTLNNAATLSISGSGALLSTGALTLNDTSTLDISSATGAKEIGDLNGIAGTTIDLGLRSLIINTSTSTTDTYSGTIQDAGTGSGGSITVEGSGTLILDGSNTYIGPTTIGNGATLQAGSTSAFGNDSIIEVQTGGTINFETFPITTGDIYNSGTLSSGATITATSFNQTPTTSLILDISSSDASVYGNIIASGAIDLTGTGFGGSLDVTNSVGGYVPTPGTHLVLLHGSSFTGTFTSTTADPSLAPFSFTYPTNELWINFLAVTCGNGTWASTSDGYWQSNPNPTSNWANSCLPPGIDNMPSENDTATFGDVAASAITVTMADTLGSTFQDVTLQALTFDASSTIYTLQQLSGGGTITLNGTPTPTINVSTASGADPTIDVPIILGADSIFSVGPSSILTLGSAGVISGAFSLTNSGAGTVVLGAPSTYSGATIINAGTLQAGVATVTGVSGAFGNGSAVTIANGGTLDLHGFNNTIESLSGSGATTAAVTLGSGTLTISNGNSLEFDGVISGTGGLTLTTGTFTLGGANTYNGSTSVASTGTLQAGVATSGSTGAFGNGSVVTISGGTLDLHSFSNTIGSLSGTGSVTLGTGAILTIANGSGNTFSGIISDTSAGGLTLTTGTLTLGGLNTYTGPTTINNGGILTAANGTTGANGAFGDGSQVTIADGGTLALAGHDNTIGTLSGVGATTASVTLGGATLRIANSFSNEFDGVISGSGTVILNNGTFTLGGVNTYSTGTTVNNAAILALTGSGALKSTASMTLNFTSTFDITQLTPSSSSTTIGDLNSASTTTFISLGANTLIVTTSNTTTDTFAGTIQDAGIGSGTGGSLTTSGAGTLILSGSNTYTGATTVTTGATLKAGSTSAFGTSSDVTVDSGGTLAFVNNANTVGTINNAGTLSSGATVTATSYTQTAGTLTLDVSSSDASIFGNISSSGAVSLAGILNVTNSGSYTPAGGSTLVLIQGTSSIGGTLSYTPTAFPGSSISYPVGLNQVLLTFPAIGCGHGTWTSTSSGNWQSSPATNWEPGCDAPGIANTPSDNDTATFGNVANSAITVTMADTAGSAPQSVTLQALTFDAPLTTYTLQQYSGAGTITLAGTPTPTINVSASTLTPTINVPIILGANSTLSVASGSTLTLGSAGVISGAFSLTNSGAGTVILDGPSTYSGATLINAGTLQAGVATVTGVSGAFGNGSAVTIADGGTLALETFNNTIGSLSGLGATTASVNLGTATLTITNGSGNEFDGIISGSTGGALVLSGGTFTLGGVNTYPGGTTINSTGTLIVSSDSNLGNASGGITFNGGTLEISTTGFSSARTLTFTGTGIFDVTAAAASATFSGTSTGAGGLTKDDSGILTLTGANDYSGNTTINAGTLAMGSGSSLNSGTKLILNNTGSTFDISNSSGISIGDLSGQSGTLISLGAQQLSVAITASDTFAGMIQDGGHGGSFSLTASPSTSVLTFSDHNTYIGGTTINSGTLSLSGSGALSSLGNLSLLNSGAKFDISSITSSISSSVADLNGVSGTVISLGAKNLTVNPSSNSDVFAGIIQDEGITVGTSGTLMIANTGTLTLSGANAYTGLTTVLDDATLALSSGGTIATSSGLTLDDNAIFDISNASGGISIGDLNGDMNTTINLGNKNLKVTTTATTDTFAGTVNDGGIGGGTGGSLTVAGVGTLVLSGANTYRGGTTINSAGTLIVSIDSNLGNISGGITFNGGTLEISAPGFSSARTLTFTDTAIFDVTASAGSATFSGTSSGFGGLTKNDSGILTLTGANNYSGSTEINLGTLAIGTGGSLNSATNLLLYNTSGSSTFDISNSSGVSATDLYGQSGTFISLGAKQLGVTISTSDTFAGIIQDTAISGGTGGSFVLNATPATSVLTFSAGNTYTGGTLINSGTLSLSGSGALYLTGSLSLQNSGAKFDISSIMPSISSSSVGDLNGVSGTVISLGSKNLTVTTSTSDAFAGIIQDAGITSGTGGSLTVAGSGKLTLSAVNTYTGLTTVQGSATLALLSPGSIAASSGVTLNGTGTFDISAAGNATIGDLNAIAGTFVTLGSNALTVTTTGADLFAGKMTGDTTSGILNVNGSGQLTIDPASTLSDYAATNVNSTFIVNGTITNPVGVTVNSGGVLGGSGTITGPTTISNGGTLTPGNSIGTINISGNYTQSPGSTLVIEANSLGDSSSVSVTGGNAVVTGSNLQMNFDPPPPAYTTGMTWTVVTVSGGTVTGDFASITSRSSLVQLTATYNLTDIIITLGGFTPIVTIVNQGNPGAVASCVDATTATPGSDLASIIAALLPLSTPELYNAFNQMQPSAFKGLAVSQQNIFLEVENILGHRFLSFFPTSCEDKQPINKPTLWLDTFVSNQTQGKKTVAPYSPQPAYTTNAFAILAGIDTNVSKNFSIGACTGYSRGIYSMHSDAGTGDVDSFYIGPYIKFGHENEEISPYFTASVLGEANWYGTNRHINFSDISRTAHGSHTGQGLLFHAGGGAWIKAGKFDISPFVNFEVIAMRENSYTESGADSLNLHVHTASYQFGELEGGILLRNCIRIPHGTIVPEISLSVLREQRSKGDDYQASLAGTDGCEFTVEGYYPDRTLFLPAAEIKAFLFEDRFTASLYYQGKFGDDFSQNELGLQFAWTF